ncbi:MAG: transporter suffix domain-containing protein [Xanthobacteraceae bacterium]
MSEHDKAAGTSKPPELKRDWRFYTGVAAMILSVIMPLGAAVVPALGLSTAHSALVVGALLAGGPEVLCILAVALLGKQTFQYFAQMAKSAIRRAVLDEPASKWRYYVSLVIILVSWIPAYLYAYVPAVMPGGNARIYLLAGMDLAFVVSVFLMGGEFWEKVRRIFVYEGKIPD